MARVNNYLIQARQAKARFLTYDQQKLIEKFHLAHDESWLYPRLLEKTYRIDRNTGQMQYKCHDTWRDGNSYEEVMTLLDLLCDSRDDRCLSGRWQNMQSFGLQFHQNLLEDRRDPWAERFDRDPELLHRAAKRLGAEPVSGSDMGYAFELFDGLKIGLLFWHGDEEFSPRIRYLWDENARQYIRYETMYFAVDLLLRRILEAATDITRLGWARLDGQSGHEVGRQLLSRLYREETGKDCPEILTTPRGKPYFQSGSLHFSISHTKNHAFCVLSSCPVGLDAEEKDRKINLRLAGRILSEAEKERFAAASDPDAALLRLWVLKEAAAKLSGEGLRGFPNHTDFDPEDSAIQEIDGCYVALLKEKNHAF